MELARLQIILQLIGQTIYPGDQQHPPPLILMGFKNIQHQVKIAETVFGLGAPITVLKEDYRGFNRTLDTIGKDFNLKILVDFEGLKNKEIFRRLSDRKLFSTRREYLVLGSSLEDFKDILKNVPIFVNSNLKFVEINSSQIQMYVITNPAQPFGGQFAYHLEKEFTIDDSGIIALSHESSTDINLDWSPVTLPVGIVSLLCGNSSVVSDEFMEWFEADKDQSQDASPRFGFALLRAFQQSLGFNITITCAQSWSVSSNSGGAVGDLINETTVVSAAPMLGLEQRQRTLEILCPVTRFKSMFTFQTPIEDDLTGAAFLKPFSSSMWLCLVLVVLIIGIAMKLAVHWEIKTSPEEEGHHFIPSLSLTILSTLGVVCQQGMTLLLNWNSSRILQVVFFLCGFVLYNYYTSLVVSQLITFPKYTRINSLKALTESNLRLGAQNISYFNYLLQESEVGEYHDLYKKMNASKEIYFSPDEGIAKARRPGFAYHCDSRVNLREMTRTYDLFELCNYHEVTLIDNPLFVYAAKHSPLSEFFKIQYMKTLEQGIASKKDKIYGEPKIACLSNALIEQVDLVYIAPVLLLLLYSMILCLIILAIEVTWDRATSKNNSNQ